MSTCIERRDHTCPLLHRDRIPGLVLEGAHSARPPIEQCVSEHRAEPRKVHDAFGVDLCGGTDPVPLKSLFTARPQPADHGIADVRTLKIALELTRSSLLVECRQRPRLAIGNLCLVLLLQPPQPILQFDEPWASDTVDLSDNCGMPSLCRGEGVLAPPQFLSQGTAANQLPRRGTGSGKEPEPHQMRSLNEQCSRAPEDRSPCNPQSDWNSHRRQCRLRRLRHECCDVDRRDRYGLRRGDRRYLAPHLVDPRFPHPGILAYRRPRGMLGLGASVAGRQRGLGARCSVTADLRN